MVTVPTETLIENMAAIGRADELASRPEMVYLAPRLLANYRQRLAGTPPPAEKTKQFLEVRKRLIKVLHDNGVGILLGSHAPQIFNVPGFSLHRELALMVAAGLTPFEALPTGTSNPANSAACGLTLPLT